LNNPPEWLTLYEVKHFTIGSFVKYENIAMPCGSLMPTEEGGRWSIGNRPRKADGRDHNLSIVIMSTALLCIKSFLT